MNLLRKSLRVPGEPRVYRRALEHGRRELVAPSIAMDRSSALKVAWWRGSVVAERSQPPHDFVGLFLHLDGARVRRVGGPPEVAGVGAAILPGLHEPEAWESEGVFEWCQFYLARPLFDEVAGERFGRSSREIVIEDRSVASGAAVAALATQARAELFREPPSALQLDAWALLIADAWLRDSAREPGSAASPRVHHGRRAKPVERAIDFIEANLHRSVSLAEMARASDSSRFHLVRLFREFVGQTPAAWARTRRIERAKRLLRSSDAPISEIALACGFADQSHFTAAFMRSTGLTPSRYRRG